MKEKDLEKLTKSQLIKMLIESKKPKKPKNKTGLEYLMDDNPFPGIVEKEDPIEKTMREIKKEDKALNKKTKKIDEKWKELMYPELKKTKNYKIRSGSQKL